MVFDKIEEALKLDVLAHNQKRPDYMKKEEDNDSIMEDMGDRGDQMRQGVFMSAIKREDLERDEFDDIRNMVDPSGDFLKNISNFASPIQDEMRRAAPGH
jgi:hypothetical protein